MLTKLKKAWRLVCEAQLRQTLWLHLRLDHPRSAGCRVYHKSYISVAKTARILLDEGAFLGIHAVHERPRGEPTFLSLQPKATLRVKGSFTLFEGGGIEVLEGGVLTLGHQSFMNAARLCCARSISIGEGCAIGNDVIIRDTDHHRVYENGVPKPMTQAIVIEDHVWVCDRALIGKGVTVGAGAVVAAGAVVTRDVPPGVLVGGNPARVLREAITWSWVGHVPAVEEN